MKNPGSNPVQLMGIVILLAGAIYLLQPVPLCYTPIQQQVIKKNDTNYSTYEYNKIYELTQEIEKAPLLFETKGTSMYPTIKEGDVCICMQKDSYKANDIVVFFMKLDDEYIGIAHRIIGINGENITTRGDNNEFLDAQIKQENILCTIPEVPKYAYNLK